MQVGDLVARAYAWKSLVPGIIVDESVETVEFDGDTSGTHSYESVSFTVAWSDGSMSTEMYEELGYLEEMLHESR
jgi:hypothetical protein